MLMMTVFAGPGKSHTQGQLEEDCEDIPGGLSVLHTVPSLQGGSEEANQEEKVSLLSHKLSQAFLTEDSSSARVKIGSHFMEFVSPFCRHCRGRPSALLCIRTV